MVVFLSICEWLNLFWVLFIINGVCDIDLMLLVRIRFVLFVVIEW